MPQSVPAQRWALQLDEGDLLLDDVDGQHAVNLLQLDWAHGKAVQRALPSPLWWCHAAAHSLSPLILFSASCSPSSSGA